MTLLLVTVAVATGAYFARRNTRQDIADAGDGDWRLLRSPQHAAHLATHRKLRKERGR